MENLYFTIHIIQNTSSQTHNITGQTTYKSVFSYVGDIPINVFYYREKENNTKRDDLVRNNHIHQTT